MLFVPVVDSNQKPLMPTTANRAARWIKSGKCTGLLRALSQPSNSFSDIHSIHPHRTARLFQKPRLLRDDGRTGCFFSQ